MRLIKNTYLRRSVQEARVGLMDNRQQQHQNVYDPNTRIIVVNNNNNASPGLAAGEFGIGNSNEVNQAVLGWLNEIGLNNYYWLFMNSGCDDLETILTLNDNDLREMGIEKLGHRKKIMNHIAKQTNDENDTSTMQ